MDSSRATQSVSAEWKGPLEELAEAAEKFLQSNRSLFRDSLSFGTWDKEALEASLQQLCALQEIVKVLPVDALGYRFWSRKDVVDGRLQFLKSECSELNALSENWLAGLEEVTNCEELDAKRKATFQEVQSCCRDPLPSWAEIKTLEPSSRIQNPLSEEEQAAMIQWFTNNAIAFCGEHAKFHLDEVREAAAIDPSWKRSEEDEPSISSLCEGRDKLDTNSQQDEVSQGNSKQLSSRQEGLQQPHDKAWKKRSDGMGETDLERFSAGIETKLTEYFSDKPWSEDDEHKLQIIGDELREMMRLATQVIHQYHPENTHSEQALSRATNNGSMIFECLQRCKEFRRTKTEGTTGDDQSDP